MAGKLDDYKMLKMAEETGSARHFIAEAKNGTFLVSGFYDREAVKQNMADIAGLSHESFPAFYEWFSENSALYTIFKYEPGVPLLKYLEKQPMPFKYRLSILKSVVLRLIETDGLPDALQRAVITPGNITVNEGALLFNYKMDLSAGSITRNNLYERLAELMRELFAHAEFSKIQGLKIILDKCEKDVYSSCAEILRDITALLKQGEEELDLKAALMEKNRNRIKTARKAAAAVCVVLAAAFLYYEFVVKSKEGMPAYAPVTEIGNVNVAEVGKPKDLPAGIIENTIYVHKAEMAVSSEEAPAPVIAESGPPAEEAEPPSEDFTDMLSEYETYIVKRGDNLTAICLRHYGNADMLSSVAEYNGLENPSFLSVGQELKLPYAETR